MTAFRFAEPPPPPASGGSSSSSSSSSSSKKQRPRAPAVAKGFDDDGEARGGQRLLGMLGKEGALGCAVVVSRWFGGEMLGKARFEHIMGAGRRLLMACGHKRGVPLRKDWAAAGAGAALGGARGSPGKVNPDGCKRSRLLDLFAAQKQQQQQQHVPAAATAAAAAAAAPPPAAPAAAPAAAGARVRVPAAAPAPSRTSSPRPIAGGGGARAGIAGAPPSWTCLACTFCNGAAASACEICETDRPAGTGTGSSSSTPGAMIDLT